MTIQVVKWTINEVQKQAYYSTSEDANTFISQLNEAANLLDITISPSITEVTVQ